MTTARLTPRYRPAVDYDLPRAGYVLAGPARRVAEVVQLWVLPFVGWPVAWWAWQRLGYDRAAVTLAMALPIACMMAVVYWGTQLAERWTFPLPCAPRGYLPQIGLIYAATLHLTFLLASPLLTLGLGAVVDGLLFVVAGGVLGGIAGCAFDYFAIRYDILRVFVRPFREGKPPAEVVAVYGPRFFTVVALVFAAATALVFAAA